LSAFDTVDGETPAFCATSRIVADMVFSYFFIR